MAKNFGIRENGPDKKTKRRIIIALFCASAAVIAAVCAVLLLSKPGLAYSVRNRLFPPADRIRLVRTVPRNLTYVGENELSNVPGIAVDQSGMLISPAHPLPDGFEPDLAEYYGTGVIMNRALIDSYRSLAEKVSEACGDRLYVMSAWRSSEQQAAEKEAGGPTAANVGESEHEAGLALDVYVAYHAGAGFLDSEAGRWVNSNCSECGFIIRYPAWGKRITGFDFEPWHVRYVGFPHADIIMRNRITLEEYLDMLKPGVWYSAGSWLVIRQQGPVLALPEGYAAGYVSPDNTGHYLMSFRMPES